MSELLTKAARVKNAGIALAILSEEDKSAALMLVADEIVKRTEEILTANKSDIDNGKASGMNEGLIDRLALSKERIADIAEGVRQVAALPDPVGKIIEKFTRPNGLLIEKVRVPLGVIGMIYEARPNVTVDSSALALKTGNSILLRGSNSALSSNKKLVEIIKDGLAKSSVSPDSVELLETPGHDVVNEMMCLTEYLDVLIPRGGASLIRNVVNNSKVPILETGLGNCHIYVDKDADINMAKKILVNAKVQRPSVCNAAETLLIHADIAKEHLPELCKALTDNGVTLHGCERAGKIVDMLPASEDDFKYEYLKLDMAVKVVDSVEEAIAHIRNYGTKHTETIITKNEKTADIFLKAVDAACVNHNASSRFTDGFQFGFGAEIGISTQKLHARGPLGLKELTSYKYLVHGNGQIRE